MRLVIEGAAAELYKIVDIVEEAMFVQEVSDDVHIQIRHTGDTDDDKGNDRR
jgi:uncharacterized protein YqgV (UPF0045/DUF77 family)